MLLFLYLLFAVFFDIHGMKRQGEHDKLDLAETPTSTLYMNHLEVLKEKNNVLAKESFLPIYNDEQRKNIIPFKEKVLYYLQYLEENHARIVSQFPSDQKSNSNYEKGKINNSIQINNLTLFIQRLDYIKSNLNNWREGLKKYYLDVVSFVVNNLDDNVLKIVKESIFFEEKDIRFRTPTGEQFNLREAFFTHGNPLKALRCCKVLPPDRNFAENVLAKKIVYIANLEILEYLFSCAYTPDQKEKKAAYLSTEIILDGNMSILPFLHFVHNWPLEEILTLLLEYEIIDTMPKKAKKFFILTLYKGIFKQISLKLKSVNNQPKEPIFNDTCKKHLKDIFVLLQKYTSCSEIITVSSNITKEAILDVFLNNPTNHNYFEGIDHSQLLKEIQHVPNINDFN